MVRPHQTTDVHQVPEGSGEQRKMEETGCEVICGAPTIPTVKGWVKVKVNFDQELSCRHRIKVQRVSQPLSHDQHSRLRITDATAKECRVSLSRQTKNDVHYKLSSVYFSLVRV